MGGKMNTETNTIAIPRKVFREIRWHLKHYNDLDDYIKTRENQLREELFDYYHFTNKNSLKNIHSYGYTVENCIIALDEDRLIRRYKKWLRIRHHRRPHRSFRRRPVCNARHPVRTRCSERHLFSVHPRGLRVLPDLS